MDVNMISAISICLMIKSCSQCLHRNKMRRGGNKQSKYFTGDQVIWAHWDAAIQLLKQWPKSEI